jgi:predicted transcriptional regulator
METEMSHPPTNGTDTSRAAAESIADDAATLRDQVLDLIRASTDGLTTDEVEMRLGLNHQTASPRVWELHKRGLIGDSGKRRETRSGRMARVYRALTTEEIAAGARALAEELGREAEQLELPFMRGDLQ